MAFTGSDFLILLKKVCVKLLEIFQLLRFYVKSIMAFFSGRYLWDDGTVATYFSWASGEPNDADGSSDCIHMDYSSKGRGWTDSGCFSYNIFAFCQTAWTHLDFGPQQERFSINCLANHFLKILFKNHSVEISGFCYHSNFPWNQFLGF